MQNAYAFFRACYFRSAALLFRHLFLLDYSHVSSGIRISIQSSTFGLSGVSSVPGATSADPCSTYNLAYYKEDSLYLMSSHDSLMAVYEYVEQVQLIKLLKSMRNFSGIVLTANRPAIP